MYNIYIDKEVVPIDSTVKYLGLILDKNWSFIDHFDYIENKISKVSRALCAIMPNLRGPREKKRRLYAHVIASIINYGAPIWSESTIQRKIKEKLRHMQRVIAIRVIAGYRTISTDASLLLARIFPADLHAAYYRRVFLRVHELRRQGLWNKLEEKEIKKEEEILLRRQWKISLQRRDIAGVRTCRAIEPQLGLWLDRQHGEMTFHATQIIAGHGCFQSYLHRIGKAETPVCVFCESEEDTPDHTLQRCTEWNTHRELLSSMVGQDLTLNTLISQMLQSEDNWEAFVTFSEAVMLAKEEEERARERWREENSEEEL